MSLIRRVKSFSVKKSKSTDELKSSTETDQGTKLRNRYYRPRKNLNKQKSLSEEVIPLRLDLEKNDLFQRQRIRLESITDRSENKEKPKPRNVLKRRESRSLDEHNFSPYISYNKDAYSSPVELRQASSSNRIIKNRSRYNTVDVVKDLINEFSEEAKDIAGDVNKPRNFPVFETDEDIQIRNVIRPSKHLERPKTYTSLTTKKKEDSFEFTRPCYLEIGSDRCIKIKPNFTMKLTNNNLQIFDKLMRVQLQINIKKPVKQITKKELEMTDTEKTIYRFYFDSTKDAKLFTDDIGRSPTKSSGGAWNQLLRLLKKRSSRDLLESKGIIKNEPIFGNVLQELCDTSSINPVPEVITRLVRLIEEPENIKSVGLYRASGNLAIIQHIRCEINCGKWDVLEKYRKDVDVLTGTLKLFFRELKEPLVPYDIYQRLRPLALSGTPSDEETIKIVENILEPNRSTLLHIIKHLLKVCSYKEENKMDLHNISICWGPSLTLYPSTGICTDLVSQTTECTTVIEHILTCYNNKIEKQEIPPPTIAQDFDYQIVEKITKMIELNIDTEGIYRKSGSNTKIDSIIKLIETKDVNKCFNEIEKYNLKSDVHDLCCVLKKFLGTWKEPLIPDTFFDHYCQVCDILDEASLRQDVQEMVDELPTKHILLLLMQHLRRVLEHEQKNKMSLITTTDIWMTTLTSNIDLQQYKKKMQKFPKLFQILISLEHSAWPDLIQQSELSHRKSRASKYDNIDDIYYESNNTKL